MNHCLDLLYLKQNLHSIFIHYILYMMKISDAFLIPSLHHSVCVLFLTEAASIRMLPMGIDKPRRLYDPEILLDGRYKNIIDISQLFIQIVLRYARTIVL